MSSDPKAGLEKVGIGCYLDKDNALHFFPKEIADHLNVPWTQEIERKINDLFLKAVQEEFGTIKSIEVVNDEPHCPSA